MQRFKSSPQAQRFLSAHAFIYGHFHPSRHQMDADRYRTSRALAFRVWQQETCAKMAESACTRIDNRKLASPSKRQNSKPPSAGSASATSPRPAD